MKAKFLAALAALATTSMALAQDDGDPLGDLGAALGGLGFLGFAVIGIVLWWFFFRGNSD